MRKLALVLLATAALLGALYWVLSGDDAGVTGRAVATGAGDQDPGKSGREPGGPRRAGTTGPAKPAVGTGHEADEVDGVLEVHVLAAGKPRAGAQVSAFARGAVDPNINVIAWEKAPPAVTNAEGIARVAARPGSWLVAARLAGFGVARRDVFRRAGEAVTRVEIRLEPGVTLTGRTIAALTKEPVPLTDVALIAWTSGPDAFRRPEVPTEEEAHAVSDAQGRFRAEGLAPGRYRVEARATGYGKAVEASVDVPHAGDLVLTLSRASFIEGFVRGRDGSPAAGATVSAIGAEDPVVVATNAQGGFSAEVPAGTFDVTAVRGGEAGKAPGAVSVGPGATVRNVIITLAAASLFEGRVLSQAGDEPIAGARIAVSPYLQNGDTGRAVSDADGHFEVPSLPPGSYDVDVSADGYTPVLRRGLTLGNGQRFPLEIRLRGTGAVQGSVRTPDGKPVAGAVVKGQSRGGIPGTTAPPEARTGDDGRFRLDGLAAGKAMISARRDQAALGAQELVDIQDGGVADVDLVLADTGVLTGKVLAKSGAPAAASATVWAMPQSRASGGGLATAISDPSGHYRMELPAGRYMLLASPSEGRRGGFGRKPAPVTVDAGRTANADVTVDEDPRPDLEGAVTEPGGAPALRAWVRAEEPGGGVLGFTTTGEDGHFAMTLHEEGEVTLLAGSGARRGSTRVRPGDHNVMVQLQPGARLRVRVTGAAPVKGFTLSVAPSRTDGFGAGETQELEFVGDAGEMEVPGEAVHLRVRTADGRAGEAEATPSAGAVTDALVALREGGRLSGRVVDGRSHSGLPDVWLRLDGENPVDDSRETGADGRFVFSGLAPGAHTLLIGAPGYRFLEKNVQVSGRDVDLGDIVLDRLEADPGTLGAFFAGATEAVVTWTVPDGPADRAGMHPGDTVVSIDGQPTRSGAEAASRARGAPGSIALVVLRRNGEDRSLQIPRAGAPAAQ